METIYRDKAQRQINLIKGLEIEDHVYYIQKLQNQWKFENLKKINEIKIKGELYEWKENVIKAIQKEMATNKVFNDPPTASEI